MKNATLDNFRLENMGNHFRLNLEITVDYDQVDQVSKLISSGGQLDISAATTKRWWQFRRANPKAHQ
jgi:hypothetical protein